MYQHGIKMLYRPTNWPQLYSFADAFFIFLSNNATGIAGYLLAFRIRNIALVYNVRKIIINTDNFLANIKHIKEVLNKAPT
jgi:hypothetical protein